MLTLAAKLNSDSGCVIRPFDADMFLAFWVCIFGADRGSIFDAYLQVGLITIATWSLNVLSDL